MQSQQRLNSSLADHREELSILSRSLDRERAIHEKQLSQGREDNERQILTLRQQLDQVREDVAVSLTVHDECKVQQQAAVEAVKQECRSLLSLMEEAAVAKDRAFVKKMKATKQEVALEIVIGM